VREFQDKLERTPSTHRELAELTEFRLLDLKDELENGDSSIADILEGVDAESKFRKYIGKDLRDKSYGRYSSPQEEELADAKKTDIRIHGVGFDRPVPIELKIADKWTGPQLLERLENQLCGDYLRDNRSSRGIYLLVFRGKKHGWVVDNNNKVDFDGLTQALRDQWTRLSPDYPNVDDIRVIGIDLTKRSS
jgi:hypothetical protein